MRDNKLYHQYYNYLKMVNFQLVILSSKKIDILTKMHEATLEGHLGEGKSLDCVREHYY